MYGAFLLTRALLQLGAGGAAEIPNYGRIIIGYAVELYFLMSSMVLVVRYRREFERRAFFTSMAAYAVIIATILPSWCRPGASC